MRSPIRVQVQGEITPKVVGTKVLQQSIPEDKSVKARLHTR
jgi:hypothetical protein